MTFKHEPPSPSRNHRTVALLTMDSRKDLFFIYLSESCLNTREKTVKLLAFILGT